MEEILAFLLGLGEGAADRFAAELDTACRLLASQPGIGRPRDDLGAGVRSRVVGYHVPFYRTTTDTFTVLRVLHGSRDIPAVFGPTG